MSAQVTLQRARRAEPQGPLPRASGTYPLRWADGGHGEEPTLLVSVAEEEATWLSFRAAEPTALQVTIDGRNAVTGGAATDGLGRAPQDYIVLPEQRWLDGVRSGPGTVEQIMGPSSGSGDERLLRLVAHRLGAAAFRRWWIDTGQDRRRSTFGERHQVMGGGASGSSAAGEVRQEIVPDAFGPRDWDGDPFAIVAIVLVPPARWTELTGEPPPPAT